MFGRKTSIEHRSRWAGPNAVLAMEREGYSRLGLDVQDLLEIIRCEGFRKMARRYWRVGAAEVWPDAVKAAFVKELQRYVPAVNPDQFVFGPSGLRAQAVAPNGSLLDDFKIATGPDSLHVLNAPSPAATASLAIAELIANAVDTAFDLETPTLLPRHGEECRSAPKPRDSKRRLRLSTK
jgi:L-2-hydroxyglutarate oxidase LhgO